MRDHCAAVRAFFDAYAKRFNDAIADPSKVDVQGLRESFAGYFVGTDPNTVHGGRNGLFFRLMIPFGYRRYRKLGCKRMELRHVDVIGLDDFHSLARTRWSSLFRRADKSVVEIEFENIYLLHVPEGGEPKIFAWITADEQQTLKQHGVT